MRRGFCFLLGLVMCLSICGCQKQEPAATTTKPVTKPADPAKDYPVVSGTFMQPGTFQGYTQEKMTEHLQYLKAVGIDLLIVQSTFNTTDQISKVYFDASIPAELKADNFNDSAKGFLDVVLAAARECDMQVYIGLANDGAWWNKVFTDQQWLDDHVNISLQGAKAIYDAYRERYADTLTGWYFWPEYWNMKANEAQMAAASKFLRDYRQGLYEIDGNMPMLLSPFISGSASTPEEAGIFWANVLANAQLKDGDIFCCQDSVGAGHIELNQLDAYFGALKTAVDTQKGLKFWANNEDFTKEFKSAPLDRFVKQLEITHKHTDTHISFAFCHYRNPDVGKTTQYEAYRHYYQTGKIQQTQPAAPMVEIKSEERGLYITFTVTLANPNAMVHKLLILKDGEIVFQHFLDADSQASAAPIIIQHTDLNLEVSGMVDYEIYVMDVNGNLSECVFESVPVYTV